MTVDEPWLAGWLEYAREVVTDDAHRVACAKRGGSSPSAVLAERGAIWPANFADDVRWPGYVGRTYRRGGVLWISNIHRNFDSGGFAAAFANSANDCIRQWRDGRTADDAFLDGIRSIYVRGLRGWTVGSWPGKALVALNVSVESVAYTNVAKCQAVDTGVELQEFCIKRWSLRRIIELLDPGLVLLTSATGLAQSGAARWPCTVVGFSQRNGRLLKGSPWKPPGVTTPVSFEHWIPELIAERVSGR
jgi:hypothetical protein